MLKMIDNKREQERTELYRTIWALEAVLMVGTLAVCFRYVVLQIYFREY